MIPSFASPIPLDHTKKARRIADLKVKDKSKGDAQELVRAQELGVSLADLRQADKLLDKLEQDAKVVENKIKAHLDDVKAKKVTKDVALLRKYEVVPTTRFLFRPRLQY